MKSFLKEIGIPELTVEQLQVVCELAERAARDHILSKVPARKISTLDIAIDTEGQKPVVVTVEVGIILSSLMKNSDVATLTKEATAKAFEAIDQYMRGQACKSTK